MHQLAFSLFEMRARDGDVEEAAGLQKRAVCQCVNVCLLVRRQSRVLVATAWKNKEEKKSRCFKS